jgi:hypothetical protein
MVKDGCGLTRPDPATYSSRAAVTSGTRASLSTSRGRPDVAEEVVGEAGSDLLGYTSSMGGERLDAGASHALLKELPETHDG